MQAAIADATAFCKKVDDLMVRGAKCLATTGAHTPSPPPIFSLAILPHPLPCA